MGKLHKSLAYAIWLVFLFLLFQFIYFYHYYTDIPKLGKKINALNNELSLTLQEIQKLKKQVDLKAKRIEGEEHARSVYMMQKKDEKLYKYLDL